MLEKAEEKQEPAAASPPSLTRRNAACGPPVSTSASRPRRRRGRPRDRLRRWCRRPSRDARRPRRNPRLRSAPTPRRGHAATGRRARPRARRRARRTPISPETRNRRVHQPPARPTSSTLPPSACSAYSAVAPRATASRRSPTRGASPRRRRKEAAVRAGAVGARASRNRSANKDSVGVAPSPAFHERSSRLSSRLSRGAVGSETRSRSPSSRDEGETSRAGDGDGERKAGKRTPTKTPTKTPTSAARRRRRRAEAEAASGGGDGGGARVGARDARRESQNRDDVSRRGEVLGADHAGAGRRKKTDRRRRFRRVRVPAILESTPARARSVRGVSRGTNAGSDRDRDPTSAGNTVARAAS